MAGELESSEPKFIMVGELNIISWRVANLSFVPSIEHSSGQISSELELTVGSFSKVSYFAK